ncbi:MAG TPA: DegT/DnrJ/EryC1/StrS family aminotransferase [Chloroflexota bacterium]|nr:DegT/DnrJ/EryC1/StrS family aminotransferase [Chloroflexota bacterium]
MSTQPQQVPFVDLKAQYHAIQKETIAGLLDTLEDMDLLLGPNVRAFEAEFAAYCQAKYAIGVGNGTDALQLALRACGVRAGDEVITVSNTFFATAEAIVQLGAVPVFVDVDPRTFTMDPARLPAAIGPRTRAIVPVHLYGQMADMDAIMDVAHRHGLVVVEDACQAHGAEDHGRRAGSVGDAAAFSFYMSKNLGAYGDGGAVTTSSRAIADEIRLLRDHGSSRKYEHDEFGMNSRLDEIQAVVLRTKLRRLDMWNDSRRAHAETYRQLLAGLPVVTPVERPDSRHVFHLFVIQSGDRDWMRASLQDRGVATGVHYPIPIHRQAACRGIGRIAGSLEVTDSLAGQILSLPMYAELEPQQMVYVAGCFEATIASAA